MPKLTRVPLVSSSPRPLTGAGPVSGLPRIAAVSPTFGRLFEGTDANTAGQTAFRGARRFTAVTIVTNVKRHADFSSAMLPNGWPALAKPVSFCQCRFRARRPQDKPHTQRSEGAWSVPDSSASRTFSGPIGSSPRATKKRDAVLSTPVDNYVDSRHRLICRPSTDAEGGSRR